MNDRKLPTFEEVSERLSYNPETGVLLWKIRPTTRIKAGTRAGSAKSGGGYRRVLIFGRPYKEHRVAWLLQTGSWPVNHIDHRNGVRSDNRFSNLREATNAENCRNGGIRSSNRSGVPGVGWHIRSARWRARITVDGHAVFIGAFETFDAAVAARKAAERTYFGEFAPSRTALIPAGRKHLRAGRAEFQPEPVADHAAEHAGNDRRSDRRA